MNKSNNDGRLGLIATVTFFGTMAIHGLKLVIERLLWAMQEQVKGTNGGWSGARDAGRAENVMLLGLTIIKRLTPKSSSMEARSV